MKTYRLIFLKPATKEWNKLGATVRAQFEKKLAERLAGPRVPSDKLREHGDCYKIKLRRSGYRLIYRVEDEVLIVLVLSVGERDAKKAYEVLPDRLRAAS